MSVTPSSATGRRKNAVARVSIIPGSGQVFINKRSLEDYFPTASQQSQLLAPLRLTGTAQTYDVNVKATGGGVMGQMSAVRHGIARALLLIDPTFRPALKKAGMLTRDPRAKERLKPGRPGARKRFQFSKR
ncbi:MAG: 30S ribosomal protein S9 [Verrucomicrobia bacterium]|nr:30S ribosomal protein S9 [Verrucomicrobiota bacterium]